MNRTSEKAPQEQANTDLGQELRKHLQFGSIPHNGNFENGDAFYMADIIPLVQLEFPWWADSRLWTDDNPDEIIEELYRPTEDGALRRLLLHAKLIERNGRTLKLNWAHNLCLRLERTCMRDYPHYADVAEWIWERTNFGRRQIAALLTEASHVIALRELLGMPALDIDDDTVAIWRDVA